MAAILKYMCPTCKNYMVLEMGASKEEGEEETQPREATRVCRNCGFRKPEEKGLIMNTMTQDNGTEAYRVFLNDFTLKDPRYPHSKTIPCPKLDCDTRTGKAEGDTIFIKFDPVNLKYLYICTVCKTHWKTR